MAWATHSRRGRRGTSRRGPSRYTGFCPSCPAKTASENSALVPKPRQRCGREVQSRQSFSQVQPRSIRSHSISFCGRSSTIHREFHCQVALDPHQERHTCCTATPALTYAAHAEKKRYSEREAEAEAGGLRDRVVVSSAARPRRFGARPRRLRKRTPVVAGCCGLFCCVLVVSDDLTAVIGP